MSELDNQWKKNHLKKWSEKEAFEAAGSYSCLNTQVRLRNTMNSVHSWESVDLTSANFCMVQVDLKVTLGLQV